MVKYYEVRFNNTSRRFEDDKEAIKHAQALDKLGYKTEVVGVEKELYNTKEKTIYQSISFNPFGFFQEFQKIMDRNGGCKYGEY